MKKTILYIYLIILCLPLLSLAEVGTGGYAGAYMKLSVEPRPAAVGGAYIAISDDAAGQLYNPAGVSAIRHSVFTSSYRAMTLDRSMGFVSILMPTRNKSALGLSWQYVGSGSVDIRNNDGDNMGTSMSSNEHIFSITFSKQFTPFLGLGSKLQYLLKDGFSSGGTATKRNFDVIYDNSASSIGINLGALLFVDSLFEYGTMEAKPFNDIKVGLVFNNLAAEYKWSSNDNPNLSSAPADKFPYIVTGGVSFKTFQRNLLVALDLEKVEKRAISVKFGGEYRYNNKFALRTGLDDGIITAGLGYQFDLGENNILEFDYAFSSARVEEGSDHLFGFHFKF